MGRGGASLWLMTDQARLSDPLAAIKALPRHSGVIVRDYDLANRRAYTKQIVKAAHRFGHVALVAGDGALARASGADGVHLPSYQGDRARAIRRDWHGGIITAAAHNEAEIIRAAKAGADAVFISPVFATQSHVGARGLGRMRFNRLCRLAQDNGLLAFALGGVSKETAPALLGTGADGLAAIGALSV